MGVNGKQSETKIEVNSEFSVINYDDKGKPKSITIDWRRFNAFYQTNTAGTFHTVLKVLILGTPKRMTLRERLTKPIVVKVEKDKSGHKKIAVKQEKQNIKRSWKNRNKPQQLRKVNSRAVS